MANYVANYVFCCEELYNDFLETEFDDRLFKDGMYCPKGYRLKDGRNLVVFETHGMEYKTKLIEKIIHQYHDTK